MNAERRIYFRVFCILAIALFLTPLTAQAKLDSITHVLTGTCGMRETVNMNISFYVVGNTLEAARSLYAAKNEEITALSAQAGISKLILSNKNYTLGQQQDDNAMKYSISGYASVMVTPADKADGFLPLLEQKGFTASLNVNAYNNGEAGCAIAVKQSPAAAAYATGGAASVNIIFRGEAPSLEHIDEAVSDQLGSVVSTGRTLELARMDVTNIGYNLTPQNSAGGQVYPFSGFIIVKVSPAAKRDAFMNKLQESGYKAMIPVINGVVVP